jgi:hypothetical protein
MGVDQRRESNDINLFCDYCHGKKGMIKNDI